MAAGAINRLIALVNLKSRGRLARPGGRRKCRQRQILPGCLLRINHKKTKLRAGTWGIAMRIYGPNGTPLGAPAANTRRTGLSGLALPDPVATPETRSAAAPKAAGNIDALLAMQGI